MALEIGPGPAEEFQHACPLPWPIDPEVPEGHLCECGRRWVYQPAHWDPLLTLDELRMRQEAGAFLRGIIPTFERRAMLPGAGAASLAGQDGEEPPDTAVIVPMRPTISPKLPPPEPSA
jgi:hypothetical protein